MQAAARTVPQIGAKHVAGEHLSRRRMMGAILISGALAATIFNVMFPRASDPTDTPAVLQMMVDHEVRRQISFLGITAAIWLLTGGLAALSATLREGSGATLARASLFGLLTGAILFTVASALGMVTTVAAAEWSHAGTQTGSMEYAIAAALNAADDGVWFFSIIAFWGSLGILGLAIVRDGRHPGWVGLPLILLGFANALAVGIPMAIGVVNQTMFLLFAGLAQLTIVWALIVGIRALRRGEETA
jgi:hypothetical protein